MDSLDVPVLTEILVKAKPSVHWLCAASTVSRKWREACSSAVLWRDVVLDGELRGNLYGEGLQCIARRCKEMRSLELNRVHILERPNPWMHHTLDTLLTACSGSLEVLQLEFCWELPFTDKLLLMVGRCCPNLRHFKLCAVNYFMTDSAISQFLRACTKMEKFQCFVKSPVPIHAPGDTVLWQISKKWPQLQALEINASNVTENGIFGLEDCKCLKVLSLHGYKRGTFDRAKATADGHTVIFDSLEEIHFTYTLPTAAELRRLLRMCPSLQRLLLTAVAGDVHAETLASISREEFPSVDCSLSVLPDRPQEYSLLDVASNLGVSIDKY